MLRSVIFGDNIYYSPNTSEIVNLFDVRHYDPKEHFIIPISLGLLYDYSNNNRNKGFVVVSDFYNYLQGFGFIPDQIDSVLNFMYSKGLLETSQRGNNLDIENSALMVRVTSLGLYHLLHLINSFTYMDAIIVDVPIFEEDTKSKIFSSSMIDERLKRGHIFRTYLDKIWDSHKFTSSYFNWKQSSSELEINISQIQKAISARN
jgi:hypothetical protein